MVRNLGRQALPIFRLLVAQFLTFLDAVGFEEAGATLLGVGIDSPIKDS